MWIHWGWKYYKVYDMFSLWLVFVSKLVNMFHWIHVDLTLFICICNMFYILQLLQLICRVNIKLDLWVLCFFLYIFFFGYLPGKRDSSWWSSTIFSLEDFGWFAAERWIIIKLDKCTSKGQFSALRVVTSHTQMHVGRTGSIIKVCILSKLLYSGI